MPVFVDSFEGRDVVAARSAEGDETCRVGAEGEEDEVIHQLHVADEIGAVLDVADRLAVDLRLGEVSPFFLDDEALLKFTNAGEVLIEGLMILASELAGDAGGLLTYEIHNTLAIFDLAHAGFFLFGASFQKEFGKKSGGTGFGRDANSGAGVAESGIVGGERKGRNAGEVAHAFSGILVNRDGVLEAGLSGMGGSGEVALFGRVAAIDVGMNESGDDGKFFTMGLERFEIGRDLVVAAGLLGKEEGCLDPEGRANTEHASDIRLLFGPRGS